MPLGIARRQTLDRQARQPADYRDADQHNRREPPAVEPLIASHIGEPIADDHADDGRDHGSQRE